MQHAFEQALDNFERSNDGKALPGVAGQVYRSLRNPVAKHAPKFHKGQRFVDRKKAARRGDKPRMPEQQED